MGLLQPPSCQAPQGADRCSKPYPSSLGAHTGKGNTAKAQTKVLAGSQLRHATIADARLASPTSLKWDTEGHCGALRQDKRKYKTRMGTEGRFQSFWQDKRNHKTRVEPMQKAGND